MTGRKAPRELGDLVDRSRPLHRLIGWGVVAALTLPFPVLAAVGPPGPLVGLVIAVPFFLAWTYGFGEWLFLEHRVYEHGIVFGSAIPGLKTFVVPHYTIDPASVHAGGKLSWQASGREPPGIRGSTETMSRKQNRWMVSYRDAQRYADLLRSTVLASQQTDPYYRASPHSP